MGAASVPPSSVTTQAGQVFPGQRLLDPHFQLAAGQAALVGERLQLGQLHLALAQRDGDAALLALEQLQALDDHQRAVQLPDLGSQSGGADLAELAAQQLHRAALCCHLQRLSRRVVPQRQRDCKYRIVKSPSAA